MIAYVYYVEIDVHLHNTTYTIDTHKGSMRVVQVQETLYTTYPSRAMHSIRTLTT